MAMFRCRMLLYVEFSQDMAADFKLFFVKQNGLFTEGTLLELVAEPPHRIPDGGNGLEVTISPEYLLPCPQFAENVPPGQCPVAITSITDGDLSSVILDQTLHYQIIQIPFPAEISEIVAITVTDRLHGWQADHYETITVNGNYRLHIGHLPPGFYLAEFELESHDVVRMTFIKFFPKQFTDRYADHATPSMASVVHLPPDRPHRSGEAYDDALLNLALELATEWGENFRKPIHERIRAVHPDLTDAEIDELTAIARQAESRIYSLCEDEMAGSIGEYDIVPTATCEFPWLSSSNAGRLKNIGMYYARR